MKSETYLLVVDTAMAGCVRDLILREAEMLGRKMMNDDLHIADKEYYKNISERLSSFAQVMFDIAAETVRPIDLIEIYCSLTASNKKEQSQDLLNSIWCGMSQEQRDECVKKLNR